MGRLRNQPFWLGIYLLFSALPLILAVDHLSRLRFFGVTLLDGSYLYYMLAFYLSIVFLIFPAREAEPKDRVPWYDVVLLLITCATGGYLGTQGIHIVSYGWEYSAPAIPTAFSILLWIVVIEAVRRTSDLSMMLVCLFFSLYPLFAFLMPGVLEGQSFDFLTTARLHAMGANGIVGIPLFTVCTLLIGFILFGIVIQHSGGGVFFYNLAHSLLGQARGGAAKIGILGSSFFGMLSGSTVSNVLAIGSMTIPAMKRTGFAPHYAAAIESCASAGGPIMPPVMGAAAFIMASFLNLPYYKIALAAAIPACLYYLGLFPDGRLCRQGRIERIAPQRAAPFLGDTERGVVLGRGNPHLMLFPAHLSCRGLGAFLCQRSADPPSDDKKRDPIDPAGLGQLFGRIRQGHGPTGDHPGGSRAADRRSLGDRCGPVVFPGTGGGRGESYSADPHRRRSDQLHPGTGDDHHRLLYFSGGGHGAGLSNPENRRAGRAHVCFLLGGPVGYHPAYRSLRGRRLQSGWVQLHANRLDRHAARSGEIHRPFLLRLLAYLADPRHLAGYDPAYHLCRGGSCDHRLRPGRLSDRSRRAEPFLSNRFARGRGPYGLSGNLYNEYRIDDHCLPFGRRLRIETQIKRKGESPGVADKKERPEDAWSVR